MDEGTPRRRRAVEFAGAVAFIAAVLCTPWIVHFASLVILRLDPGATPASFSIVYRTANDRYAVTRWPGYTRGGFQSFRLPDAEGFIDTPKIKYSFRVLEDDGSRQLVQVESSGSVNAVSRYAVEGARIVPVSYRGLRWGMGEGLSLAPTLIALALGIAAVWGVIAVAGRFARLQQT